MYIHHSLDEKRREGMDIRLYVFQACRVCRAIRQHDIDAFKNIHKVAMLTIIRQNRLRIFKRKNESLVTILRVVSFSIHLEYSRT